MGSTNVSQAPAAPATDDAIGRALAAAFDYIAGRECRRGGFCSYRTDELEEPNLHDSYYAAAACGLLDKPAFDRKRLVRYLLDVAPAVASIHALYYHAFTARQLGIAPAAAAIGRISRLHAALPTPNGLVPPTAWLDTMLKTVRLKKAFTQIHVALDTERIMLIANGAKGSGHKPNLEDAQLALSLLAELGYLDRPERARRFVDELQAPVIGFRLTRDSALSNVDVLYAGITSCALLHVPVRHHEDITRFVLLSQRASGGFSRAPDSQGDMQAHYRALAILRHLRPAAGMQGTAAAFTKVPA
jgi:hypothetical protein